MSELLLFIGLILFILLPFAVEAMVGPTHTRIVVGIALLFLSAMVCLGHAFGIAQLHTSPFRGTSMDIPTATCIGILSSTMIVVSRGEIKRISEMRKRSKPGRNILFGSISLLVTMLLLVLAALVQKNIK